MPYRSPKFREPSKEEVVGTVVELFAGVGGFRIGLARSGWKTIFSNQWEPATKSQAASECYVHNFGDSGHTNVNFSDLVARHLKTDAEIPRSDLIVGGFPCQDYSVAKSLNSARGLEGKKGVLWWDIHKLISRNQPRFVFLENVDRLLKSPSSQRGRDFAVMLSTLGSLGYLVEWRVANAADYGFPQRRKRVFIVATRKSKPNFSMDDAEECIKTTGVLARALPILKPRVELELVDLSQPVEVISSTFGEGLDSSPFKNAGVFANDVAYTVAVEARRSSSKKSLGDILVDVPDESSFWVDPDSINQWKILKDAKRISRTHKESGRQYFYAEGSMAFPDLLSRPARTILTAEGGNSPSRFKHIIKIGRRYRRLTPVELERLNGFPDHWTAHSNTKAITDSKRAFFMGNALVVGLVAKVGSVLADEMRGQKTQTQ